MYLLSWYENPNNNLSDYIYFTSPLTATQEELGLIRARMTDVTQCFMIIYLMHVVPVILA